MAQYLYEETICFDGNSSLRDVVSHKRLELRTCLGHALVKFVTCPRVVSDMHGRWVCRLWTCLVSVWGISQTMFGSLDVFDVLGICLAYVWDVFVDLFRTSVGGQTSPN